jgi:hypothetical protein
MSDYVDESEKSSQQQDNLEPFNYTWWATTSMSEEEAANNKIKLRGRRHTR